MSLKVIELNFRRAIFRLPGDTSNVLIYSDSHGPENILHVHWMMLSFGIRIKNTREIIGQIPRLLVGGVKSFVGHIPVGNTGGANVPPLRPMEIPKDLQENDEENIRRYLIMHI